MNQDSSNMPVNLTSLDKAIRNASPRSPVDEFDPSSPGCFEHVEYADFEGLPSAPPSLHSSVNLPPRRASQMGTYSTSSLSTIIEADTPSSGKFEIEGQGQGQQGLETSSSSFSGVTPAGQTSFKLPSTDQTLEEANAILKEGITDPVDLKKSVDEELGPEPSIMDETGSPKRKGAVLQEEVDKVERSLKMKKVADANES